MKSMLALSVFCLALSAAIRAEDAPPPLDTSADKAVPPEPGPALKPAAAPAEIATLTVDRGSEGAVRRQKAGEDKPEAIKAVKPLFEKDEISTGDAASAQIDFRDGTVVRLGAGARLAILERKVSGEEKKTVLNLKEGRLRMKVSKLDDRSSFTVQTPVAVCGVRGTRGIVGHDSKTNETLQWTEEGVFGCRNGAANVPNNVELSVGKGQGCRIRANQPAELLNAGGAGFAPRTKSDGLNFIEVPGFTALSFEDRVGRPRPPGGDFSPGFRRYAMREVKVVMPPPPPAPGAAGENVRPERPAGGAGEDMQGGVPGGPGGVALPDNNVSRFLEGIPQGQIVGTKPQ
jgi:hypothetical protein